MENHGLTVGDLVELKSGSPLLTVEELSEKPTPENAGDFGVLCSWFDGPLRKLGWFRPETLRVYQQDGAV